ncbi:MAG: hypothetical protein IT200_12750 [Thermoleophilia bacterium]|nr:hypothetical protein [Thermoleophilia bacterium]
MSDITPRRLDELLAGDPPRTDAARDVLHMAAALRGAAPGAPDGLRERVMATARTAPARRSRLRPPAMSASWTGPAVAGVAAIVIGAAVILPGLGGDGPARVSTGTEATARGAGKAGAPAAGGDMTAPAPDAVRVPAPAQAAAPPEMAAPSTTAPQASVAGAAVVVVVGPSQGWPATALDAVATPLEASGGVVTAASTGTARDGREDLTVEALVPAGKETQAVDAVTAALPAETAWQPSEQTRTAVGKDAAGDTVRPDAAPKDLAGPDAVPVIVVVVRDGAP